MPESSTRPATVVIADDHTLFREGLAALISRWADFELVGSAGDGLEAVQMARQLRPRLVLMDVRMPVLGGVEATAQITAEQPETTVVMLTMSTLGEDVFDALRNGAHGFLSKDEAPDRLHSFLVGVLKGEVALSGTIAGKVLDEFAGVGQRVSASAPALRGSLSSRERDVLRLLVQGLSNDEIAREMYVSEATVKKHLGRVMTKLHMRNRVQVAVYSVRVGLVD